MGIMETVLEIPAEHEANVFGQFDAFAKKIERSLHVTLISRDGVVKIMGDSNAVERARNVLSQLLELSRRGNTISEQNVNYTLALVMEDSEDMSWKLIKILSVIRSRVSRSSQRRWDRKNTSMRSVSR